MIRKRIATLLGVATLVATSLVLTLTPPASAEILDVTCLGSHTSTYTPPVTLDPQTGTSVNSTRYGPCVSLTTPGLTSGSQSDTTVRSRTCLDLLATSSGTETILWNDRSTSTLSVNRIVNVVGLVYTVTSTGSVTAGRFKGDAVVQQRTGPATDILLCTVGLGEVDSIHTTVVLEITSL